MGFNPELKAEPSQTERVVLELEINLDAHILGNPNLKSEERKAALKRIAEARKALGGKEEKMVGKNQSEGI